MIETYILNLAIASGDVHFFTRLGLNADWFSTHKPVYEKFSEHCRKYAEVPSLAWLVSETDTGFNFDEPEESADTLVRKLKESRAKSDKKTLLQQVASDWATVDAEEITSRIKSGLDEIDRKYGLTDVVATDWVSDGAERVTAYEQRKSSEQTMVYTGFDSWNDTIGPFKRGDYCVIFASPKRGKTHISRAFLTLPAVRQGYTVLDIALEQPRDEIVSVLDSIESAHVGVFEFNGQPSGFSERSIIRGDLDTTLEQQYFNFVQQDRRSQGYGGYIVKTLEDPDMDVCNLDRIESLITLHKPDVVLIDQASLLTYEKVRDQKAGASAEATSRRFRRICIKHGIIGCMLVQAQIEQDKEEDGMRVLSPPDATKIKTSKSFVEDASTLITLDSTNGKAILKCERARLGGAGFEVNLSFFPNYGICREVAPTDLF